MESTDVARRVLGAVGDLRPGEVMSYGDVADDAGLPGRARAVGRVLACSTDEVAWWRVVTAAGRLVPGNEAEHAERLRAEGVEVRDGFVRRAPLGRFAAPATTLARFAIRVE